jgi:uncharacterized protein YndB with AHSA1/START domain
MTTDTDVTTQVHRIYISAAPERIWAAIVSPEWTVRYGYAAPVSYDLRPGGEYRSTPSEDMRKFAADQGFPMPDVIVDGEVLECDPPRRLVQTWRMLMDPNTAAEPFTRLTYEIEELPHQPGVCRLTVIHDLTGAPVTASQTRGADDVSLQGGGGWPWILSDLKSLLETGTAFSQSAGAR